MAKKTPFTCVNCGFTLPYRPTSYSCLCGYLYKADGSYEPPPDNIPDLTIAINGECPHLGEQVGEIDPQHCGCGVVDPVPVHLCGLHEDIEVTLRTIPNVRYRRERSCMACMMAGENEP